MADELFETLSDPRCWHRQSSINSKGKAVFESSKAHAAFRMYAEMGDERSLRSVAKGLGKSGTLIERWARRWKWHERTKVYDDFLQEEYMTTLIRERRKMAKRQADAAVLGQEVALEALKEIQRELQKQERRRQLRPFEVARLFDVCSKIERICRGEPDEDQVARINVNIRLQERPRYAEKSEAIENTDRD